MTNWTELEECATLPAPERMNNTELWNALSLYVRSYFYFVKPSEAMYEHLEDVPNLQSRLPFFLFMIFAEWIVLWLQNKPLPPLTDASASGALGMIHEMSRFMIRGAEYAAYYYIHEKFRLVDLPWDSTITWYGAAILVDLAYYWGHRAAHEINFFWAHHQAHHSSEYFTLISGLRLGTFNNWGYMVFYLPIAFFIPPAPFLLHAQLNFLFQFWVHTEVIESLGPLEYIFNSPSHHRVHHGSNDYCLDKNYGSVLIIWDRMFGTFAPERKDEEIVYGLVEQVQSVNPVYLELFYFKHIYDKFFAVDGWKNKVKAIVYGPAWEPGSPRLGWPDKLPGVKPRTKWYVPLKASKALYFWLHFLLTAFCYMALYTVAEEWSLAMVWLHCIAIILTVTCFAFLYEEKTYGPVSESIRCLVIYALMNNYGFPLMEALDTFSSVVFVGADVQAMILQLLKGFFASSAILWGTIALYSSGPMPNYKQIDLWI